MLTKAAGYQWLKDYYNLSRHILTHSSYIGNSDSIELTSKGNVEQVYGTKYAPKEDTPLLHLEFALKYDDLNLDFLKAVFEKISVKQIKAFIRKAPSGKYTRKIGFLFEFLTGKNILLNSLVTANYVDLLEEDRYITGAAIKNIKWKINNNLLGNEQFCPLVRKNNRLIKLLKVDIKKKIQQLKESYPQEIFKRAASYLYGKETRSSYEIEKEKAFCRSDGKICGAADKSRIRSNRNNAGKKAACTITKCHC